jgi:dienelactone hydrolase
MQTPSSQNYQDYTVARAGFRTKLRQRGPAPQEGKPFRPPVGSSAIVYSPSLGLKALVSPNPNNSKGLGKPEKYPAVLFLHGGFGMDASDWEASQPFRDAGFLTMTPLLRGENGQAGAYTMFYDEVTDVLAAAETLAALPYIDTKHLYVAGHSVGGTLALLAALCSKRFRAAAAFSGSCNQIEWSAGQPELIPFDPNDRREFQMRSPIAFATSFKCPTRIYYGTEEPEFAEMSKKTAAIAKTQKLDVEAIAVRGNHFTALSNEMQRAIAFFQANQ